MIKGEKQTPSIRKMGAWRFLNLILAAKERHFLYAFFFILFCVRPLVG
jgi:hypothetical protein